MISDNQRKRDRAAAIAWAQAIKNNPDKYLILDIGGIEPSDPCDEVRSIAITTLDGATIYAKSLRASIEKSDAPTLAQVWPDILRLTNNHTVLVYNEEFIDNAISQTLEAQGLRNRITAECVMLQYAAFVNKYNARHEDYTWQKLPGPSHDDPEEDCLRILAVINAMAKAAPAVFIEATPPAPLNRRKAALFWALLFVIYFLCARMQAPHP